MREHDLITYVEESFEGRIPRVLEIERDLQGIGKLGFR